MLCIGNLGYLILLFRLHIVFVVCLLFVVLVILVASFDVGGAVCGCQSHVFMLLVSSLFSSVMCTVYL